MGALILILGALVFANISQYSKPQTSYTEEVFMWHLFAKDEVLGIASWDEESWGNNISLFEIMLSKIQIDFSIDGDKKTKDDFMHMLFLFQSLEWDHLNRATIVKKISGLEMTTRTTTLGWDMDIVSGDLAEIIALFKSN